MVKTERAGANLARYSGNSPPPQLLHAEAGWTFPAAAQGELQTTFAPEEWTVKNPDVTEL